MGAALIIIDIQNAFCNPAADGRLEHFFKNTLGNVKTNHDTAERIKEFVEKVRGHIPIIWVGYHHTDSDGPAQSVDEEGERAFYIAKPADGDVVFYKEMNNAFDNETLQEYLRDQGYDKLYFAGVNSHACLFESVKTASCRGFKCNVLEDLISSSSRMTLLVKFMTAQLGLLADKLPSSDMIAALRGCVTEQPVSSSTQDLNMSAK